MRSSTFLQFELNSKSSVVYDVHTIAESNNVSVQCS
jgi:hypothetical protein